MLELTLEPLTKAAFAAFGDVIETENTEHFAINGGSTQRYHDLAKLQHSGSHSAMICSIFRGQAFELPLTISMMEHHPFGSQLFMPLSDRPYVVVVASAGALKEQYIRAFLAQGNQGVNYHSGVWHHPLISLQQTSDFLVIDRSGKEANCVEKSLSAAIRLIA
ncbi:MULTISPECIES: ureidoglycolate lyase [unclassified Agarivorans]|uniref:ureidoglycolate lyase n=1 Tax=unclassified Agarivorans TaxID=2636026 RepID=UPI0026E26140|nr:MULTISPECIES: ureidoglycolate lyase [unclassified Agarivorans]MDO6687221.1 ureidoglycolate lyase [Agarivorans sp. 3_MG-2023]MDO6716852.1 ureidoglycolate lyase [Agarivorans sp. 2_MG-2023]